MPRLQQAIDMHHHGYPESTLEERTRHTDADSLRLARASGMAGIVFKSHFFPTVGRTYYLNEIVEGITAYGSITLDPTAGGFNPVSVEAAALQGARSLWMPTWGAEYDMKLDAVVKLFRKTLPTMEAYKPGTGKGLVALDEKGKLKTEVCECLAVAQQYGMVVNTGHLDPKESIVLADRAKDFGIDEIIFTHPYSTPTRATDEQVRDMQQLGAIYEMCGLAFLPSKQQISMQRATDIIGLYGADKVILSTDTYFTYAPPAVETLRLVLSSLMSAGLDKASASKLVKENPRRLLRLDA